MRRGSSYSLTVKVDDGSRKRQQRRRQVGDHRSRRRGRDPPSSACRPESGGDTRLDRQRASHVGRAREHRAAHHRLRGALRRSRERPRFGGPHRRGQEHDHHGADGGTRYEVQVRAKSDEGTGDWSRSGTGMPNPDVANRNPAFSGGARTFSVPENTAPSTDVGSPSRRLPTATATADLHPGRDGRGLVRHPFDLRRRPDTDERGTEPRGEVELLGDGPGDGRQGRDRRGQRDDQGDGR